MLFFIEFDSAGMLCYFVSTCMLGSDSFSVEVKL